MSGDAEGLRPRSKLAPAPIVPPVPTSPGAVREVSAATDPTSPPLGNRPPSSHSHGSDSSHSSHSSVQARKRQEAFGSSELPSVAKPAWSLLSVLAVIAVCQAIGLYLFTRGFLLTRAETSGTTNCTGPKPDGWQLPRPQGSDERSLIRWDYLLETEGECTLPPTFERSLILMIDALRYDFIAKPQEATDTWQPSRYMHNHLRLPSELEHSQPDNALLALFVSDAPTTTLQRLKGLTTGSLPTFVDAGSNFGAEAIREDNWIAQYRNSLSSSLPTTPRFGFMGDDTWLKVYPSLFDSNWTWPFDSFNVEDLHTVDEGVRSKLLPLVSSKSDGQDWRLLIAHTLGVDHVGHRHGPDHAAMTAKLQQMDKFVREVVDELPDDALFILAGDHGMDATGDHGGESELEVGSGIFLYSKRGFSGSRPDSKQARQQFAKDIEALHGASMEELDSKSRFGPYAFTQFTPLGTYQQRAFPQTDLVPSIALLLGAAPPFGNLGSVIPELFAPQQDGSQSSRLLRALRINARQIRRYLRKYSNTSKDFRRFEHELHSQWITALQADAASLGMAKGSKEWYSAQRAAMVAYQRYNRLAMNRARSIWATFSFVKIVLGIGTFLISIATIIKVIRLARRDGLPEKRTTMVDLAQSALIRFGSGAIIGCLAGCLGLILQMTKVTPFGPLDWPEWLLFGFAVGGQVGMLSTPLGAKGDEGAAAAVKAEYQGSPKAPTRIQSQQLVSIAFAVGPLLIHASLFASNSLTMWEDSIVHTLLALVLLFRAWRGWSLGHSLSRKRSEQPGNEASAASARSIAFRAKQRVPFLLGASLLLLRLAREVKVCREEQAPTCQDGLLHLQPLSTLRDTASSKPITAWAAPIAIFAACYASSYLLPHLLVRSLRQSRSDTGLVRFWSDWIFRPSLMLGSGWWIVDWIGEGLSSPVSETSSGSQKISTVGASVQWGKNLVARADFALIILVGLAVWIFAPLCLEVKEEEEPVASSQGSSASGAPPSPPATEADRVQQQQRRVQLLGFSNVFASSYLLLFTLAFSLVWLTSQPLAQLTLAAAFVTVLALADVGDAERDLAAIESLSSSDRLSAPSPVETRTPRLIEMTTLHLLAHALFFSTGHQATFLSIQWRSAFIGFSTVVYPWSPILVVLNTYGPLVLLTAMSVPLLLSWNLPPTPRGPTTKPMTTMRSLLIASLYLILAASLVTLSSAVFATWFRRHLMLFKIWAPRYMLTATALLGLDAALIAAAGAWCVVAGKISTTLGTVFE